MKNLKFAGLVGNQLRQDLKNLADFVNNAMVTMVTKLKLSMTNKLAQNLKLGKANKIIGWFLMKNQLNAWPAIKLKPIKATCFNVLNVIRFNILSAAILRYEEVDNYPLICRICIQNNPMLALEYVNPTNDQEIENKSDRIKEEKIGNVGILTLMTLH